MCRKIILGMMCIVFAMILLSCGGEYKQQKQDILDLHKKAKESDEQNQLDATLDYLIQLVRVQQQFQAKNPKKIDVALLEEGEAWASEIAKRHKESISEPFFGINYASVVMLQGAYHNAQSDIVSAVEKVSSAIQLFDGVVEKFPDSGLAHGYRAVNFSSLPDLFGKADVAREDFLSMLAYINSKIEGDDSSGTGQGDLSELERSFFIVALDRMKLFFEKQEISEGLDQIEPLKAKLAQ